MKKGFTLFELIIVVLLVSILVGVVGFSFSVGLRSWNSGRKRVEITEEASLAVARMGRELRQASEFITAKTSEVTFEADLDGDASVETITFKVRQNADELERTEGGTVVVLARDVDTFTLGYYLESDNDNLLSSATGPELDQIRVVVITLTLTKGDETISFTSSAYTRNQGLDDE